MFPGGAAVKNPPANAGDARVAGSISGSGRSPGTGNGNPLQYSCLENPMDRGAWWASPWDHKESATMELLIVSACVLQSVWSNEKREFSHSLVVCVALEGELSIGTAGKADTFCGLLANFCSLKAKKIPVGKVALGDWLGCYRVGMFTQYGVRELAGFNQGSQGNGSYGAWSVWEMTLVQGLGTRLYICDLGTGLHESFNCDSC